MAKIKFVHADDVELIDGADFEGEPTWNTDVIPRTNKVRYHLEGSDGTHQLFEPWFAPHTGAAPHAHDEDETIHVLEGELHFGSRIYPAGSTIYIPGGTLYAFRAGAEGCRFLNFRSRADASLITREEHAAARNS